MSRRAPSPPGAPSHGRIPSARPTQYATHPTPSEEPLAPYVPPIFTQYDRPRAPSAASTATTVSSAASGSSLLSAQTDSTGITQLSNISSAKRSPPRELSGSHVVRPGPVPLQDSPGPFAPFRRSDPGQAPAPSAHGSGGGFAPRRQTLPSETTTAFSRTRPFQLSQPPRGPRNTPARGSTSRALWGREGLPVRQSEPRYTPTGPPAHPPSAPPYPHHVQHTRPSFPGVRGPPNPQSPLFPPPLPPTQPGASFFGRGFPPSGPGHPSPGVETTPNPLSSSLTRDALLEHAYKLYDNPAPGSLAPMGLTTRLLQAETSKPELADPIHTYRAELLPLLGLMRTLHPSHTPIALLLGCVQYAVKDYEGSLRTNKEILATDPNCVEAMSNIAMTFRAMGNLHDAEQWWMHAIRLRPSYWDAIENMIGFLCNPYQTMGADIPGDARQPQFHQALVVCKSVLERLIPGPTIQSCLSTGLIRVGEAHRLQNLLHTSGNLKFILASRNEHETDLDKEFAGIKDQFVAVELMLNGRIQDEQPPQTYLTVHDLLLGLAVSALHVTGNLPPISLLEIDDSNLDLLPRIHTSYRAVLNVVAPNNILPLVFIKPENIFTTMRQLFASTKGLFPGVVYEAGSLNLEAIPPVLPAGATNASRMTATVLLTIAKHFQDAARRGISLPNFSTSSGQDAPAIRASLSGALLLYYCALALHPSASVCNNLGILLSTLPGVRITCLAQPPGASGAAHPETETLTGPALARAYYQEGLKLDPNHPHLLTNVGSLLKDEGKLEEAMQMYSRALEIKPDFDVALANMANATKDAGNILESVEYYKRAVLSNPYFPESIVGLANALGSICDWQGRGGLTIEMYLDNTGSVIVRNEEAADSRTPGFLDELIEICDSQILEGYHASTGIIASDRTLEQWMETIEACLGTLNPTRRERWEAHLKRFYTPFDRAEQRVYEAGTVVRLVEMLSRVLQRRWYIDQYRSNVRSTSGATREPDLSKYNRPKLPAAMVAPLALSILPFQTFTLPLTTRMIRIISHRNAIRTSYLALSQDWLPSHVYAPPAPPSEGRLKVGYISSDFNNHPLSHLMQSVFDFHDAKRFEVYCYATTKSDGSKYRARIETSAHHFVDVTSWPTSAVVEKIQTDGIHILVNLNGYTKGARNDIFAVRPAPIIISLMGFAGTLSAGWSDYILTDPYASSPPGSALDTWRACWRDKAGLLGAHDHPETISLEHNLDIDLDPESVSEDWMFSEKFIIMPHTCFVTDHKQAFRGDDRENDAALRARGRSSTPELIWKFEEMRRHKLRKELFADVHDDWIIYANFNQLYKVEPVVFNVWLRILAQTPKSILWLLRFPTVAESNIIRCARQWAGPEITSRIRFTDVAPKEKHIERCRVADLFLDTIECNAHTVATDVLWSGTPIVTWPRYEHKMCSRVAASIAYATGYGRQMVVSNLKEYEDRAIDFANSLTFVAASDDHGGWYRQCRGTLSDLRRNLYLGRDHMPLFDTLRWTRNVERGYSEAWRRWENGTEFENSEEWLACSGEARESACIRISEN